MLFPKKLCKGTKKIETVNKIGGYILQAREKFFCTDAQSVYL